MILKRLFKIEISEVLTMKASRKNFIKRLKQKKEDAIEYVIEEYMSYLKAIVYRIHQPLGDSSAVEECLNDVFLIVWKNADKFDGDEENFKYWIGTIAKYKAIDQFRVIEKRKVKESSMPVEDTLIVQNETVSEQIVRSEEKDELLLALSTLETIDRDIFMLKYFLDMSNGEIAESLNLSKAAVDNRLYRGKKKLSNLLNSKMEGQWT